MSANRDLYPKYLALVGECDRLAKRVAELELALRDVRVALDRDGDEVSACDVIDAALAGKGQP